MAMQITPEQTDWLSKFLGRNLPDVTPEMAVNTAGPGAVTTAEPGLMERFDSAVNGVGKFVFGDAGRVPGAPPRPASERPAEDPKVAVPVPGQQAAPTPPAAAPAAPEPGLMERFDDTVNGIGKFIFGDAGRLPGAPPRPASERPAEDAPIAVPVPSQEAAPPPPAEPEPGLMERFDGAVNGVGKFIFGDAGRLPGAPPRPASERPPEPAPIAVPVPGQEAAPTPSPAAPEPGLMDRFDSTLNDIGKFVFGDAGRVN